jgi:hypothetical protein
MTAEVAQPADSFAGALILSEALIESLAQAFLSRLGLAIEFALHHGEVIAKCGQRLGDFVEKRGLFGISISRWFSVVSVPICGHPLCPSKRLGGLSARDDNHSRDRQQTSVR